MLMLPVRQLKCVVADGLTPAPVLPVMALMYTSPFSAPALASGSKASCMQVAKQPGLATCIAPAIALRCSSGKP